MRDNKYKRKVLPKKQKQNIVYNKRNEYMVEYWSIFTNKRERY